MKMHRHWSKKLLNHVVNFGIFIRLKGYSTANLPHVLSSNILNTQILHNVIYHFKSLKKNIQISLIINIITTCLLIFCNNYKNIFNCYN